MLDSPNQEETHKQQVTLRWSINQQTSSLIYCPARSLQKITSNTAFVCVFTMDLLRISRYNVKYAWYPHNQKIDHNASPV